jgi:hypothetical protein
MSGHENIFIEEGAKLEFVTLNFQGPFIGKDTEIMEGSVIRGPFALCEGAVVKWQLKYKELLRSPSFQNRWRGKQFIISAYSNKGHDGF